ncbi:MAG: trimethylamine methyltransferase family protein [Pirellulales bacterium]|nr:trimethylamine methyltransferase family protein [Pirellulales bacterium]
MLLEPIRVLSPDDMEKIHQSALTILEQVGMRMESEKALSYLKRVGCRVDESSFLVRFPRRVVQSYVDKMKADYAVENRFPEQMAVRYSHVRFRREKHRIHPDFTVSAGGFCCFIHDLDGTRRSATMDDVRRSIHLADRLEAIDYTGLPVSDQETPGPLRPVKMAAELAKYTTKFGGVETFKKEDVPYLIEIGSIVKGGLENLRREPILVGYAEARSPLCLDRNMVEIFMDYIERGFPQTLDTMPNGGATAPVTAAGLLALGIAETLGPMVLAYAIDENAVIGVDIIPSYCDMKSGLFRYATADRMPLLAARVQLITEYYGCPSGVHGLKTDSCFVNVQCGIEKAMSTVFPVLAGAVGIGVVGHLENAVTFSPQQLVIDNEVARYMHRALQPIEVNERTLALDAVRAVGIGGNYLSEMHTAEHFRRELFFSDLFETAPWSTAHGGDAGGMERRSRQKAGEIWQETPEIILDGHKLKAIDEIVARAAKEFVD